MGNPMLFKRKIPNFSETLPLFLLLIGIAYSKIIRKIESFQMSEDPVRKKLLSLTGKADSAILGLLVQTRISQKLVHLSKFVKNGCNSIYPSLTFLPNLHSRHKQSITNCGGRSRYYCNLNLNRTEQDVAVVCS